LEGAWQAGLPDPGVWRREVVDQGIGRCGAFSTTMQRCWLRI
jgi:hypothetical protein